MRLHHDGAPCMTTVSFPGPSLPAAPRIPQPIWLHEDGLRGSWRYDLKRCDTGNAQHNLCDCRHFRHGRRCLGAQHRVTTYPIQPFSPNHHLSSRWRINNPTRPTCKVSTFSKFFKLAKKIKEADLLTFETRKAGTVVTFGHQCCFVKHLRGLSNSPVLGQLGPLKHTLEIKALLVLQMHHRDATAPSGSPGSPGSPGSRL